MGVGEWGACGVEGWRSAGWVGVRAGGGGKFWNTHKRGGGAFPVVGEKSRIVLDRQALLVVRRIFAGSEGWMAAQLRSSLRELIFLLRKQHDLTSCSWLRKAPGPRPETRYGASWGASRQRLATVRQAGAVLLPVAAPLPVAPLPPVVPLPPLPPVVRLPPTAPLLPVAVPFPAAALLPVVPPYPVAPQPPFLPPLPGPAA